MALDRNEIYVEDPQTEQNTFTKLGTELKPGREDWGRQHKVMATGGEGHRDGGPTYWPTCHILPASEDRSDFMSYHMEFT